MTDFYSQTDFNSNNAKNNNHNNNNHIYLVIWADPRQRDVIRRSCSICTPALIVVHLEILKLWFLDDARAGDCGALQPSYEGLIIPAVQFMRRHSGSANLLLLSPGASRPPWRGKAAKKCQKAFQTSGQATMPEIITAVNLTLIPLNRKK